MTKKTVFIAGDGDDLALAGNRAEHLYTDHPFEFFPGREEASDRRAERAVKAAILFLLFLIVVLVGFLVYLGVK